MNGEQVGVVVQAFVTTKSGWLTSRCRSVPADAHVGAVVARVKKDMRHEHGDDLKELRIEINDDCIPLKHRILLEV